MLRLVLAFIIFAITTVYAVNLRICGKMFIGNSEPQNLVLHDYLTCKFADLSFLLSTHREFENNFYSKPV